MPEKPNRTDPNTAHQVGREDVPLSLRETVPSRTTPPTHRARQMDLNNDGTITEEEMRKYNEMYAAMSSANRAPRGTSSQARRARATIDGLMLGDEAQAPRLLRCSARATSTELMLDRPASRQMQRSAASGVRGKGSCEIWKYADAYASMARCSPFAKSASSR